MLSMDPGDTLQHREKDKRWLNTCSKVYLKLRPLETYGPPSRHSPRKDTLPRTFFQIDLINNT